MKVNWIKIENVKSFTGDYKFELNHDYNFVVGTNGSGKTTLLQVISSCLLKIVPLYKPEVQNNNLNQRVVQFNRNTVTVNLPKNYRQQDQPQKISLSLSLSTSKDGLLKELKTYEDIFKKNNYEIENDFNGLGDIPKNIRRDIEFLEKNQNWEYEFVFRISEQNTLEFDDKIGNERIEQVLHLLETLELYRSIYNYLFLENKTDTIIEKGFRIIHLNADRVVGFPDKISIAKNDPNQKISDTSYSKFADIGGSIYNTTTFDYIQQTLQSIGEKYVYERWSKYNRDAFDSIKELKEIKQLVYDLLGFELILADAHHPSTPVDIYFKQGSHTISFNHLSSGEKSLIFFLFTLANAEIKNSFIVIDEAEIHLHSNMQDKLLEVIFSKKLKNQHFITTHSPKLINRKTISSVLRLYKDNDSTKYVKFRKSNEIGHKYDLLRLINSQNNEKIFFADKVVLVEGIKDRIIIESALGVLAKTNEVIEVIDVGGKANIELYRNYLNAIKVDNLALADFDYLIDTDKNKLNGYLTTNNRKIDKILKDKNSKDKKSLLDALQAYVDKDDKKKVSAIIEHIDNRSQTIRKDLTAGEKKVVEKLVKSKRDQGLFIISSGLLLDNEKYTGEIEDYLVDLRLAKKAIKDLVVSVSSPSFFKNFVKKADPKVCEEFFRIISHIIYGKTSNFNKLITEISK